MIKGEFKGGEKSEKSWKKWDKCCKIKISLWKIHMHVTDKIRELKINKIKIRDHKVETIHIF